MKRIRTVSGYRTLHAVTGGEGPVVILLHGFPEFWYGWRKQIPALVHAGFQVVAPDGRGYNLSDKPRDVAEYAVPKLVSDVLAFADQIECEEFCLAGHDWGAFVAWAAAMRYPDRVRRLAILNVPHPAVARSYLRSRPRQMLRSWYALAFQIPAIPEFVLHAGDFRLLAMSMIRSSRSGTFTAEELDAYKQAWAQPGALTGMINWYRAAMRYMPKTEGRIRVPTRIIWGERDAFLLREMAEESLGQCDTGDLITLPEATHWLHHEEPDRINSLLIEWFRQ